MTSASLMQEAEYLKLVPWTTPEGWGEQGSGGGFQYVGTHVNVYQKSPHYCKVISLQLK